MLLFKALFQKKNKFRDSGGENREKICCIEISEAVFISNLFAGFSFALASYVVETQPRQSLYTSE